MTNKPSPWPPEPHRSLRVEASDHENAKVAGDAPRSNDVAEDDLPAAPRDEGQ